MIVIDLILMYSQQDRMCVTHMNMYKGTDKGQGHCTR